MSSMSPPAGSPGPPAKRGRGRGSRGGAGAGGAGRGRGGGGGKRQKRQSTVASESAANTPAANGATPAGLSSVLSPGTMNIDGREGSIASMSRRSNTTKGAGNRNDGEGGEGDDDEMEDDDEEGDNELDLLLGDDEYDEQAKERSEAKEALRLLLDQFSPEQLERYEVYRRSGLQKAAIRRLINHVLQQSCTPNIIVAVRGLAKVFIGEMVESARQVQDESGRPGPLLPDDLREAYQRYKTVQDKKGSERAKLFVR